MGRTVRSSTTVYCEYCHRDANEVGNGVITKTLRSLAYNFYDFTFCGEACMQAWTKEHLRPEARAEFARRCELMRQEAE